MTEYRRKNRVKAFKMTADVYDDHTKWPEWLQTLYFAGEEKHDAFPIWRTEKHKIMVETEFEHEMVCKNNWIVKRPDHWALIILDSTEFSRQYEAVEND